MEELLDELDQQQVKQKNIRKKEGVFLLLECAKTLYVFIVPLMDCSYLIPYLRSFLLFILYAHYTTAKFTTWITLLDYVLDRFVFDEPIADPQLTPYSTVIPRVLKVAHATSFGTSTIRTYRMNGENRGVLFLVNNIDFLKPEMRRNGAEVDKIRLLDLFNQLGFTIFYNENLKVPELLSLVQQLSTSEHLRQADCLFFVVLTHGDQDKGTHFLEFSDGNICNTESIMESFDNKNCSYLIDKPRVFLFQSCRGSELDRVVLNNQPQHSRNIGMDPSTNSVFSLNAFHRVASPTIQDLYICNATIPNYAALRDEREGSLFIKAFVEILAEHSHKYDFDELMTLVQTKINEMRTLYNMLVHQTTSYEKRGVTKKFYINPGCYQTTKRLKLTLMLMLLWSTVKSYFGYYSDLELFFDNYCFTNITFF